MFHSFSVKATIVKPIPSATRSTGTAYGMSVATGLFSFPSAMSNASGPRPVAKRKKATPSISVCSTSRSGPKTSVPMIQVTPSAAAAGRASAVDEAEGNRDLHHSEQAAEEILGQHEVGDEELSANSAHEQCDAHVHSDHERHPGKEADVILPRHPECDWSRHDALSATGSVNHCRNDRDAEGDQTIWCGPGVELYREPGFVGEPSLVEGHGSKSYDRNDRLTKATEDYLPAWRTRKVRRLSRRLSLVSAFSAANLPGRATGRKRASFSSPRRCCRSCTFRPRP